MLNLDDFASNGDLFDGRYKLLYPLSKDGGTADVWLAIDMNTVDKDEFEEDENETSKQEEGLKVAIKVYRPQNALDIEGERRFRDEYTIVYNCHHTNLLQPYNFSIFKETPYLVMPYCQKGSSEQLIGKMTDENELWRYIHDVAAGLAYLHGCEPPIIHQDVKPANVLMHENGNYALTDFGISSKSGGNTVSAYEEEVSGTMAYMAPERFTDSSTHRKESDIWAFGATLYELLTGTPPFGENGGYSQTEDASIDISNLYVNNDIKKLISACLSADFSTRPTAHQLEEAANMQMFPVRNKGIGSWTKFTMLLMAIVILAGAFFVWQKNNTSEVVSLSDEELYEDALRLINSNIPDSVRLGIERMDTLASQSRYVPALYQLGFTFGCYSDSLSLQRKQLLGVELGADNINSDAKNNIGRYMAKDDKYNMKAIRYLTRVVEAQDTCYTKEMLESAYRLGIYYLYYTENLSLADSFFRTSLDLAEEMEDKDMEDLSRRGLIEVRNIIQKHKK